MANRKHETDDEAANRLAPLVDLAVRHAPALSDIQLHRGQRRLQQALSRPAPPQRRGFVVPLWTAAAVVTLLVGVGGIVLWQQRAATLVMDVQGAFLDANTGNIVPHELARPAQLRFSDGSHVEVAPRTRTRLQAISAAGATLALESGGLHAQIAPRHAASWDFNAGPFTIHVVGTAFDLDWQGEQKVLAVAMHSGQVSVSGPLVGERMPVSAGQTLHVSLLNAKVRLETPQPPTMPQVNTALPKAVPLPAESPRAAAPPPEVVQARRPERWSQMLRAGAVAEIVADARAVGISHVLQRSSLVELQALADAARYMRDNALATRALQAQRFRFAGSKAAREAAFYLGRVMESSAKQPNSALAWYDRYLAEDATGTYRTEALGRKMVVLEQLQQTEKAREVAQQYLRHDAHGAYAKIAHALLSNH